ncbi:MAG: hypothetical protein QOD92_2174 [Acidimicrobiaceae bacterium]|jgi:hypothetical protein
MTTTRKALEGRLAEIAGVTISESMFGHGDAYWVNGKEVAHFEGPAAIEVRLTRSVISERRAMLKADERVDLRRSGADWITVRFATPEDAAFVSELVATAVDAHKPAAGTPAKPPPTGPDLERRRRFH